MLLHISGAPVSLHIGNRDKLFVLFSSDIARAYPVNEWDATEASVITIGVNDWNHMLSPWKAPACFPSGEEFSGGADEFLEKVLNRILPEAERAAGLTGAYRAACGYSLAGLFSLYAITKTNFFQSAASVSGSLWFDGFPEYLLSHPPVRSDCSVYLSLGDREAKVRNARLKAVGENTQAAFRFYQSVCRRTIYEVNPGNHFENPEGRMLRAMNWLLHNA